MKIVERILNKKYYSICNGDYPEHWGELIFLYNDGTWEKIFEYHWNDPFNTKLANTTAMKNRTRDEAITVVEKAYYKGTIQGHFTN